MIVAVLITGLLAIHPALGAEDAAKGKSGDAGKSRMETFHGTLQTGVMAIGAETTGITLTTETNGVYELDLKNPKLKASAEALNGKTVTVEGIYKPRPGVEVKERRIIEVKRLAAAP